jgi:hypothetical protein
MRGYRLRKLPGLLSEQADNPDNLDNLPQTACRAGLSQQCGANSQIPASPFFHPA